MDKQLQMGAKDNGFTGTVNLDDPLMGMTKPDEFEKKPTPLEHMFGQRGKLLGNEAGHGAKYTATVAGGNHNGLFDFAKATGPTVPFALQKIYGNSFQNRAIHNLAGGLKQFEQLNGKVTGKWESLSSFSNIAEQSKNQPTTSTNLRPLSPHLPLYQPQINSTLSILNRISGVILTSVVLSFYFLYMKTGLICFTNESFYQCLFYSSKLNLLALEISALAFVYHVVCGVCHLVKDFSVTK